MFNPLDKVYQEKVEYIKDSKIRDFATVVMHDEDHTIGNVVRC